MRLSARMREQYPEEMTVVLQHQFWDLKVTDDHFEVGLSFGGVPESLLVPFDAIKSFFDPSMQFGLQFETIAEASWRAAQGRQARRQAEGQAAAAGAPRARRPRTGRASAAPRHRRPRRRPDNAAGKARRRNRSARPVPQEVIAADA